jgi:hypothetical protein
MPLDRTGQAAVRALDQYNDHAIRRTARSVPGRSREHLLERAGLSNIGVSYTVINSLFSHNHAIGRGANPAQRHAGRRQQQRHLCDDNNFTLSCGEPDRQHPVEAGAMPKVGWRSRRLTRIIWRQRDNRRQVQ